MIRQLIEATKEYKDPIQWHPEPSLYHHVAIVTARAYLQIGDMSVICAAILHDLAKPLTGRLHAKTMADMIQDDDDIKHWIWQRGGDWQLVEKLVYHHMDKKVTTKNRVVPFMDKFFEIDDMVWRYRQFDGSKKEFILPDGTPWKGRVSFVGLSPIQAEFKSDNFTLSSEALPMTFPLEDVDWILKMFI